MNSFQRPTGRELMEAAIDINEPTVGVELVASDAEDRIWINVDGVCVLRIQGIKPGMFLITKENGG